MRRLTLNIYVYLGFLICISAQQLPVDQETQRITYKGVVEVGNLEAALIFERAMEFINSKSQHKWLVRDLDMRKLSKPMEIQAITTYDFKYKNVNIITFVILIEVKDGKYRYTLNEFETYKQKSGPNNSDKLESVIEKLNTTNRKEMVSQINDEINKLLQDLKEYVIKGKSKSNSDDW